MSQEFKRANPGARQSMIDIFVENQSKLMAELGTLFSFTPKFTKLPSVGDQSVFPDFESPSVDELRHFPLDR